MKRLFILILPLFLFTHGGAQNFIDGGFQDNLNNWVINNAQRAGFGINGDAPGNFYVDVTPNGGSGNGASIEQKINFKTACTFRISFQIRPGGPKANSITAGFRVEMDGNVLTPARLTSNDWSKWVTVNTDPFPVTTGSHVFRFIGDNGESYTPEVMGIDNVNLNKVGGCGSENNCCPGKNLICNGGFDEGRPCFESQYSPSNTGNFKPGSYTITDFENANQLCKNWSFNAGNCKASGKAMFVNGNTNGQGTKVIWSEIVPFNAWNQYRFCANVYAFKQCCFNVTPKITMTLSYQSGGQTKTVTIDAGQPDACGWVRFTKNIAQWEGNDGGKATISISLDETGAGDGNDFAIDNISLVELAPLPKTVTNSVTITAGNGTSITGNFTGNLAPYGSSSEVGFVWIIVPLTANGQPDPNCPETVSPPSWWSTTTNFPGFDGCKVNPNSSAPGVFLPGKSYKIVLGTFGFCYAWDAKVFTIKVDPATKRIAISEDPQSPDNPASKQAKPNNDWIYERILAGKKN